MSKPVFQSILLVDDDNINNYLNERLIKRMDLSKDVKIALNGAEAIKILRANHETGTSCPSLILLDINMPVMDGFDFLEKMQELELCRDHDVNIIMLTTSSNPEDLRKMEKYGLKGFINKPLTEEKLLSNLEKLQIGTK